MKVYRIEIKLLSSGWCWVPTDARGTVTLSGGRTGYARKFTAARGAKRAHPHAKVVVV